VATDASTELGTTLGEAPRARLPAGVVTFMLTDIEGSSRLWESDPDAMRAALALHDELLERSVDAAAGVRPLEQGEGDSAVVAFAEASRALGCALELQRGLAAAEWPAGCELRVRIALHSGEPLLRDPRNYVGAPLNRCARLRALAHGGQTLVSRATYELVAEALPERAGLRALGPQRLRDLGRAEEVFELIHPELPSHFPALRSLDALPNNLPVQLSSFVGRQRELREVERLITQHRLLTLTGAGGCGKTRLAVQAASETLERFPDGAWWVELAPLSEERLVGAAIAEALGVRPLPGMTELQAAGAYLASRKALVILDNCEHLAGACAEGAGALLQAAPELVILATSRAPLGIAGEREWRVPSLSLPGETTEGPAGSPKANGASDAVALFIERATAARPNLALGADDADSLARICTELDGLPLAIELAAARIRILSVGQVEAGLSDRFRLLSGGPQAATPRLQTIRASIDWSHELLRDQERVLFRRLAVFAGGATVEAVDEVCVDDAVEREAMLDLLASLVERSLVIADPSDTHVRYRLLETVRQYALERLAEPGEEELLRARHRDHFLALAERAAPELETRRQSDWVQILDPEAANLAAAMEFALLSQPELALRFGAALYRWWHARGRFAEAELAYSRSLEAGGGTDPGLRARALQSRAAIATIHSGVDVSEAYATEALALADEAGDRATAARARLELGLAMALPNPNAGRAELERAAELARAAGDEWALVQAQQLIADASLFVQDHRRACGASNEVAALAEKLGDPFQVAKRHWHVCVMAVVDGRMAEARDAAKRMHAAVDAVGDPLAEASADCVLGLIDVYEGAFDRALERLNSRFERAITEGVALMVPLLLTVIGLAELSIGRLDDARGRLEALLPLVEGRWPSMTAWALEVLAEALRLLGDDGAASRAQQAQAVGEKAGAHLWATQARLTLGRLAAARGEWTDAREHALAHLDACVEGGHATYVPACLDALGEVAVGVGQHEDSVRLFAAAERARAEIGIVRVPPEEEHWEEVDDGLREALGDEAYERARAEGVEMSTEDAVEWVRRARGRRRRPPDGWDSLTPTEVKVAGLAAAGLTNPQIGERMFISTGTVKTHLTHIFGKLDLHSRAELAAEVTRRTAV
jgi:predicted ATPase/class 3 adenylate cyclase/DNA-binding CsgD family transcriptional regulator